MPEEAPITSDSPKPQVGKASAIMMASLFASRVLGILRDSIAAAQFGLSGLTDAYVLAFQIPDLLFFLIAGGALSSAFIPVFSEYLHTGRRDEAWKIFNSVVTIMSLGLIVMIGLTWVFTEPLVMAMNGPEKHQMAPLIAHMSRIVLPAQFAFFIGGLMFGTLYAHQRFAIPGLGPNVYNVGIILGATVISHFVSPGIVGMAWGALIGAIIGNLIVPGIAMRDLGHVYRPELNFGHPGVKKVFKLMLPVVLGLSLPGVYNMIMRAFASHYPAGVVTSLDLGNKLMQAPLALFGQSFAIAIFPALSQFFANQQMDRFREQMVSTLRTAIYITAPVAVFFGLMASDIVHALLNYGAFRKADPSGVVEALQIFAWGIPAWCLHPILMRGYFAMQQTVKPIVMGTLTTVLFVMLSITLQPNMGWKAMPLASSVSAIVLASTMTLTLRADADGLDVYRVLQGAVKAVLSAAGFGLVVWLGSLVIPTGANGASQMFSVVAQALFVIFAATAGYVAGRRLGSKSGIALASCLVLTLLASFLMFRYGHTVTGNLLAFVRMGILACAGGWSYFFLTKAWGMKESEMISRVVNKLNGSTESKTA